MQHRVIYNEGAQTIRHVPVDRRGRVRRVTSATYSIVDLRHSDASPDRDIGSGAATVGAVNTLLTSAAGAGTEDARRLLVTSAAGLATGHTYAMLAADGRTEAVILEAIDGLTVHTALELGGDYTTADRLVDVELSASFPSGAANDEPSVWDGGGPYQATWQYTVDDQLYLVPEIVWLTRYSVQPFVTPIDVLTGWPTIGSMARYRIRIEDAIAAATRDYVVECESAQRDPSLYRATMIGRTAVCERAIAYVMHWNDNPDGAERHDAAFRRLVNQLLVGAPKTGAVTVSRQDDTAPRGGDRRQQGRFVKRS